ncbi:hypothetical protein Efla_004359 [Eimeria flavescens]
MASLLCPQCTAGCGAAGVYVNSVGLTAEEGATDALGRSITAETRRLLSPDEWAKVLRAANLQLSVALAQLNSPKALLVVNLSEDAEPLSVAFSRERRLNTFLSVLAWSRVQAVSHELRFFLSRVEALVLVDVPNPVAESLPLLISMLYHAALFAEGAGDTAAVLQDAKLLSALSASCSPLGFPPEPDKDNAECLRLSKAATERLEVYSQHLDGQRAPRLHVSPVGDAYYLKRFISPPDMPSQYLPHSVRTLEESKEQRDVVRFLTDCLPIAFGSQRLRYAKPSQQPDAAAGLLAAAVASMHARIIPDL